MLIYIRSSSLITCNNYSISSEKNSYCEREYLLCVHNAFGQSQTRICKHSFAFYVFVCMIILFNGYSQTLNRKRAFAIECSTSIYTAYGVFGVRDDVCSSSGNDILGTG